MKKPQSEDRHPRKLQLSKDTIRTLQAGELEAVVGGEKKPPHTADC
jgi:hypothetical protein